MNVINLSLGEPEIDPKRDIVVQAINAAAAAGVVPVVAAGNDFSDFGYGSVSSPGSAAGAITVAAVDANDVIADFSSAGPTPVSLAMKPDVAAPGVSVLSSLPGTQGSFGLLSGTSMASPHVAGAAALLKERHPSLDGRADQVGARAVRRPRALAERRRGALDARGRRPRRPPARRQPAALRRADRALVRPPAAEREPSTQTVSLTDAGGGAGDWTASTVVQTGSGTVSRPGDRHRSRARSP